MTECTMHNKTVLTVSGRGTSDADDVTRASDACIDVDGLGLRLLSTVSALVGVRLGVESRVGVVGTITTVVAIVDGLIFDALYVLAW